MTETCLRRVAADDRALNAFILVMADEARRRARELDAELAAGVDRGPLHGVPVSIKDLIDVAGTPTTAASRVRLGHVADNDAPAVASLRRAGAVIIGKTNLHEFAFGTTNEDSAFGPSRHPRDLSRSPGGSSGGSAVSVAAGMALASVGTDTGGSIRIPAAACGIVGLKPRLGDISTEGVTPLSSHLDHVGPLAESVADARVLYLALAGRSLTEPASVPPPRRLTLAVLRPYFCDELDGEVRARFDQALERLEADGVRLVEGTIRDADRIATAYLHIVLTEAAAYHAETLARTPERYTAPVRERLEAGRLITAEQYTKALEVREQLRSEVDAALAGCDALVLPALAIPAPKLGAATVDIGGRAVPIRSVMLRLTQLFNLTGHPAIALPAGTTAAGLPCSVQLAGRSTDALLGVAAACEAQIAGSPPR